MHTVDYVVLAMLALTSGAMWISSSITIDLWNKNQLNKEESPVLYEAAESGEIIDDHKWAYLTMILSAVFGMCVFEYLPTSSESVAVKLVNSGAVGLAFYVTARYVKMRKPWTTCATLWVGISMIIKIMEANG